MALEKNSDRLGRNILTLRHRLKMTQSEFIKVFFRNPDGSPMFSVAKLSNIETKGCSDPEQITNVLSEKLEIPPSVFHLRPVEFSSVIDSLLKDENSVSKIHFFPSEDSPTVRQTYSSNIVPLGCAGSSQSSQCHRRCQYSAGKRRLPCQEHAGYFHASLLLDHTSQCRLQQQHL